jgi:hypothetical protein
MPIMAALAIAVALLRRITARPQEPVAPET